MSFSAVCTFSQQVYFADGYHGGIYGHYPDWQTQFMVDKLEKYPEWCIGLEIEPETWDSVQYTDKSAYDAFKRMAADRRIDFTNPSYAQPYLYNISGETIIRQFEYGIKKIHSHFPAVTFNTYAVEEPCFTSCLPQILKSFGFKYAVMKNPNTCWGGYTRAYGGELVNWIGPDGSRILTVPRYASEVLEENSTWQTTAWNNSTAYLEACFRQGIQHPIGMCYQDAGWRNGPWLGYGKKIKNNSVYVTWTDYISAITSGNTEDNHRFSQEDILVSLMWGSQALQQIAQAVRTSENNMVMAEKLASMAVVEKGFSFPEESMEEAWRTLMLAQHHDSWIVPYNKLNKYRTWTEEIVSCWTPATDSIAGNIISCAVKEFGQNNTLTSGKQPRYIRVFNTTGKKRSEQVTVKLPDGWKGKSIRVYNSRNKEVNSRLIRKEEKEELIFSADVPSFGYATYRLEEKASSSPKTKGVRFDVFGNCILENDMYKITLNLAKGGILKSLIAKTLHNREFVDTASPFGFGELRGYFYEQEAFRSSTETSCRVNILEDNELRIKVELLGQIASHPFTQVITITAGQEQIDHELTIHWDGNPRIGEYEENGEWKNPRKAFYDDRFKLNVLFPASLAAPQLYKNAPFDVCKSELENTFYNRWDSIKHNIILNWVDIVQENEKYGMALLADHTTSYSFGEDFPLGLTAQYSGRGLWGADYTITGPLKIRYALIPHEGNWEKADIWTKSNTWNEPLIPAFYEETEMKDHSCIDAGMAGYEITAVKAEGNDLLVRLFNPYKEKNTKQTVSFNFPLKEIHEVELNGTIINEKLIHTDSGKNTTDISIPQFGIKTFKIKR